MHPYCMAICVENEAGEQIMPEGGIILEIVDKGENGEPILAIPDMIKDLTSENEPKVSDEDVNTDSLEHIVVDDDEEDVTASEAPVKIAPPETTGLCLDVKDENITKRQKEEIKEKSPPRRKKKKKCKEQPRPDPVERRVLRSGSVRNAAREQPKEKPVKEEKKQKVPKAPLASTPASSHVKPKEKEPCQTETQPQTSTIAVLGEVNVQQTKVASLSSRGDTVPLRPEPERSQPSCSPTTMSSQDPSGASQQPIQAPADLGNSSAAPAVPLSPVSAEIPAAAPRSVTPEVPPPVSEVLPPVAPEVPEPKPKALSLAEYRRLRQQKKPPPVEKPGNNSTKWPSLPEPPKDLPPIPCLPDPSPRDPRRPNTQPAKKEVEEIKPAWQPRGPCVPPTPEALLVPPAYMVASVNKVSAATCVSKPQKTPEPSSLPQKTSVVVPNVVKDSATHQNTTTQPSASDVPKTFGPQVSLKPNTRLISSVGGKCSALSGGVDGVSISQSVSPKRDECTSATSKTTTDEIKPAAATGRLPSVPQKTTVVSRKVPEVTVLTSLNNTITSDGKFSKSAADVTQLCPTPDARLLDSQSGKTRTVVAETKESATTAVEAQRAKSPTRELLEAFTSEIGELKM